MLLDSPLLIEVCEELLRTGRHARFRVEGHSMWPTIRNGDIVEIAPLRGRVQVGSIVLYRGTHGPLVHRVVEYRPGALKTQGEAAAELDPPVSPGQVLGRVTRVYAGASGVRRRLPPFWIAKARWWLRSQKRALRRATLPGKIDC